jgi:hypothetical protein
LLLLRLIGRQLDASVTPQHADFAMLGALATDDERRHAGHGWVLRCAFEIIGLLMLAPADVLL